MMTALLTVYEAAELLFGTRNTVAYKKTLRLIHSKQIHALKDGQKYLVPRAEIERLYGTAA
jgi:excisionase family DNA binding protein